MLKFSSQQIIFNYIPNTHLKATLTITNDTQSSVIYKLKITRPRYYLVKPITNLIRPRETLTLQISMHKQGISDSLYDKFKCFYKYTKKPQEQLHHQIQTAEGVETRRIPVKIMNLPEQMRKSDLRGGHSEVKTIFNGIGDSRNSRQTTLQGMISEKQERVVNLRNEISQIKMNQYKNEVHGIQKSSWKSMAIILFLGIIIGGVSSMWI